MVNYRKDFQPDCSNILNVLYNRRPDYLPLYEHNIDEPFIAKAIGQELHAEDLTSSELEEYYRVVTGFWKGMTYDAMSYEAKICEIFPDHGAILGGRPGPIQTREDYDKYPWEDVPRIFIEAYKPHLDALVKTMPQGMKAYGGCGYGIFEAAEDLVGYEQLCMMQFLDPDLFRDLFVRIGDLYMVLWRWVLDNYADLFVFCRMGDDLGYRTSTMLDPDVIRLHILPQHKRVIDLVHGYGKKFLLHSCGNIFSVMDDILANGIDAKHSNEDQIAPYTEWIERYGERIGLFGGIDMNELIINPYEVVYEKVLREAAQFRSMAKGYGLGSGNSIPDYMSVDGFMAMVDAANEIRLRERK